ncbi:hypothetical protein EJ06DRAFT_468532 [Trichodelitschia bisporula]|uniref:Rhodopsin domain-containing protein n=1 Tax=Trichodelitschia bisporula TaxID=703511 RepID=A0A6G1IAS9_9PEZI|nr:hypothetical protein EJ06DRAFT_468532 [Trichodelitschia bisporula]
MSAADIPGLPSNLPPDVSRVPLLMAITVPFFAIALCTYVGRIWVRVRPVVRLGWDDAAISIAVFLAVAHFILVMLAATHKWGRHIYYIPMSELFVSLHYNFAMQSVWTWCITFVKISVALMLLRVTTTRGWVYVLWGFNVFLVFFAILTTVLQFVECDPYTAYWNRTPDAKCWSQAENAILVYTSSVIFIVSDIFLSLFPLTFVSKLNRPRRDKIALLCIMGLGLIASATSIAKIYYIKQSISSHDPLWAVIPPSIWGDLEKNLGIIASCVPCLRAVLESLLRRFGMVTSSGGGATAGTNLSGSYKLDAVSAGRSHRGSAAVRLDRAKMGGHGGTSAEYILDNGGDEWEGEGKEHDIEAGRRGAKVRVVEV